MPVVAQADDAVKLMALKITSRPYTAGVPWGLVASFVRTRALQWKMWLDFSGVH